MRVEGASEAAIRERLAHIRLLTSDGAAHMNRAQAKLVRDYEQQLLAALDELEQEQQHQQQRLSSQSTSPATSTTTTFSSESSSSHQLVCAIIPKGVQLEIELDADQPQQQADTYTVRKRMAELEVAEDAPSASNNNHNNNNKKSRISSSSQADREKREETYYSVPSPHLADADYTPLDLEEEEDDEKLKAPSQFVRVEYGTRVNACCRALLRAWSLEVATASEQVVLENLTLVADMQRMLASDHSCEEREYAALLRFKCKLDKRLEQLKSSSSSPTHSSNEPEQQPIEEDGGDLKTTDECEAQNCASSGTTTSSSTALLVAMATTNTNTTTTATTSTTANGNDSNGTNATPALLRPSHVYYNVRLNFAFVDKLASLIIKSLLFFS